MTLKYSGFINFTLFTILFSMALSVSGQIRPYRVTDRQVRTLIDRIETRTDNYRREIERVFDNDRDNGARLREEVTSLVNEFENSTDDLKNNFTSRTSSEKDVREVLNRAAFINTFMRNNRVTTAAQTQWNLIRSDLNTLATYYRVRWNWDTNPSYPTNTNNLPYRVTDNQVATLLNRIEARTDTFRRQVDGVFNSDRYDNSKIKEEITSQVNDFENSTDELKNSFTSRRSSVSDAQEVLNRAAYINTFMRNNRVNRPAQSQWNLIRADLNTLADYYRISWNWNTLPTNPTIPTYPRDFDARLTGTYRLNTSQSDNVDTAIERAIADIVNDANQRERIQRNLERRLTSPDMLAFEKRGQQVTMASSMSPQVTFNADGVSRSETNPNGRTVQIRATATNSDLTINYEGDRINDFYVSFMPSNNGQLRVTRRVYLENRNETVTVASVYDKTDQIARWETINNETNYPNTNYPVSNTENYDEFIIANNTRLTATLDSPISTKTFKEGDRFSMTVNSPSQYQGAVIEGRVNAQKSGVISGRAKLTLDFESIRLQNGKTYRFAGIVDQVREPNGNNVSVNNEGTVRDGNQTTKTVTRAGIGAAIGAIIGAIAGGGQGAAIGAGIGAGAGAGSVVLQGRDNLELPSGTEFSLTASAPANR